MHCALRYCSSAPLMVCLGRGADVTSWELNIYFVLSDRLESIRVSQY